MMQEAQLPRPDLSIEDSERQNRESFEYLRSLAKEDGSTVELDDVTRINFFKRAAVRTRPDTIKLEFHIADLTELYYIQVNGIAGSEVLYKHRVHLASGLITDKVTTRVQGSAQLKDEDEGKRTTKSSNCRYS